MERIIKVNGNARYMFFNIQQEDYSVLDYADVKDKQKQLRRMWNKIGVAKCSHGLHFGKWKNKIKL